MTDPEDSVPPLSRTQVVLYALVGLFVGTVVTGAFRRQILGALDGDETYWTFGTYGLIVGVGFATLVALVVATRIAGLRGELRRRIQRIHTIALAVIVVGFLVIVAAAPELVGLEPLGSVPDDGFVGPSNAGDAFAAAAPLAAAAATLVVLSVAYLRMRRAGAE